MSQGSGTLSRPDVTYPPSFEDGRFAGAGYLSSIPGIIQRRYHSENMQLRIDCIEIYGAWQTIQIAVRLHAGPMGKNRDPNFVPEQCLSQRGLYASHYPAPYNVCLEHHDPDQANSMALDFNKRTILIQVTGPNRAAMLHTCLDLVWRKNYVYRRMGYQLPAKYVDTAPYEKPEFRKRAISAGQVSYLLDVTLAYQGSSETIKCPLLVARRNSSGETEIDAEYLSVSHNHKLIFWQCEETLLQLYRWIKKMDKHLPPEVVCGGDDVLSEDPDAKPDAGWDSDWGPADKVINHDPIDEFLARYMQHLFRETITTVDEE
ncbi:hypothetical protein F4677DRAFT_442865 [Hypoxylon crocopeplum]|nr:hypothetical protein F4677DRAFT_442865 [Hypoxylon crocopeplum]